MKGRCYIQQICWSFCVLLGIYFLAAINKTVLLDDVLITEAVDPPPGDNSPIINLYGNNTENTTKIVGGTWVKRGAHPYQTVILFNGSFICGGTLIDDHHVLTAAHCLDLPFEVEAEDFSIYLLTTVIDPPDNNTIVRNVSKLIIHEDYNLTTFRNDIGIMRLDEPVEGVRPVRLENFGSRNETHVQQIATAIGWGRIQQVFLPNVSSGPASNNLRQVNVTVISNEDCQVLYYNRYDFSMGDRFCTSTLHRRGICQGDSGGPIFINGTQIGISSAAGGCADPRFPAVFTRVGAFREWISEQIRNQDG